MYVYVYIYIYIYIYMYNYSPRPQVPRTGPLVRHDGGGLGQDGAQT